MTVAFHRRDFVLIVTASLVFRLPDAFLSLWILESDSWNSLPYGANPSSMYLTVTVALVMVSGVVASSLTGVDFSVWISICIFVARAAWSSKQTSRHYITYHSRHPGWYSYFPGYPGQYLYFPGNGPGCASEFQRSPFFKGMAYHDLCLTSKNSQINIIVDFLKISSQETELLLPFPCLYCI